MIGGRTCRTIKKGSDNEEWYMYDASGTRVLQRSTIGSGASNTTITVYPFGLEEHVYNGAGTLTGSKYYYSLGGRLVGKTSGSGAPTFFLTDLLGSVLADFSGASGTSAVAGNQTFGPYGNLQYFKGSMGTLKGFTGQYQDDLSGLHSFGARSYDQLVGTFILADTVQGNMQGMNPYAYVGGNPETHNDPSGRYVVGLSGQTYYPGSSYYIQGGKEYSLADCTVSSCSVTLPDAKGGTQTFTSGELRKSPTDRINFLVDFYNKFARGFGQAELDFINYLLNSGRLNNQNGYRNVVDFQLILDQMFAAFDTLNHAAQNSHVSDWLTFMTHPSDNGWWTAHNGSIDAADQQARSDGLYEKQSTVQQMFINETIHVINGIQTLSSNIDFVSSLFGPQTRTTGNLASLFYPGQNDDLSTGTSLVKQGLFAGGFVGLGTAGAGIDFLIGGPAGAGAGFIIGGIVGISAGLFTYFELL